jgi:hypothetical protein
MNGGGKVMDTGSNFSLNISSGFNTNIFNESGIANIQPPKLSSNCLNELNTYFGKPFNEVIQDYCSQVEGRLLFLVSLVFILWLFEPLVKKYLELKLPKQSSFILFLYKWIGLGFIFMIGFNLWMLGGY